MFLKALIGPFINAVLTALGGLLGGLIKTGLPESMEDKMMKGMGGAVVIIGISMGLKTQNVLVVITSIAIGLIIGELLHIDILFVKLGNALYKLVGRGDSGRFGEAFVTATCMTCIGAMAVTGSLESGLSYSYHTMTAKGIIDFFTVLVIGATVHPGAAFAAVPLMIYQGAIALLASLIAPILSAAALAEISATGGVLVMFLGLKLLGILKLDVANFLPAVFVAIPLSYLFALLPL